MIGVPLEQRLPNVGYTPDVYLTGLKAYPPWLRYRQQQFYVYSFNSTINTPTNQQPVITMEGDSFFFLEAINIVGANIGGGSISQVLMSFADTSRGLNWAPNAISLPNMSGRGETTKYLSHPTLLKPLSSVLFNLNNVPSTTPIYGSLIGRKVFGLTADEARFLLRRVWYQYDIETGPLAGQSINSYPVQMSNDSDFYLWKLYGADAVAQSLTTSPLTVAIRDVTTNKDMFNRQAGAALVLGQQYNLTANSPTGGSAGKGFSFTIPRLIKRNSTVIVDMSNTAGSGSYGPSNFVMEGVRVFD